MNCRPVAIHSIKYRIDVDINVDVEVDGASPIGGRNWMLRMRLRESMRWILECMDATGAMDTEDAV